MTIKEEYSTNFTKTNSSSCRPTVTKLTTAPSSLVKPAILVQKLTPAVTTIDVQDDKEVAIVVDDNEVDLTEDEIWNIFQDTSSEAELGNEWLKASSQALQKEPSSLQEPANVMHIQICDEANVNFPVKISGINVVALHDTGANMSCMSYACYMKWKDLPSLKIIFAITVY